MLSKDESRLELQASAGMYTRLDWVIQPDPRTGDLKTSAAMCRGIFEERRHLTR